jgi:hypothetical protein
MKKGGYLADLRVWKRHRWHAFIRTAIMNNFTDQVALYVVSHKR